jgi:F0F1-type ATP synthase delta subunit
MKHYYAQAVLASLKDGIPVEVVLSGLTNVLHKKRHGKLLVPVLHEVIRVLETRSGTDVAEVRVARSSDIALLTSNIKLALTNLGTTQTTSVREVIDETLIGGFVTSYNYREQDMSYKRLLKSLYESITK